MNAFKAVVTIAILATFGYWSCSTPQNTQVTLPPEGEFFDHISDYGIFEKNNFALPSPRLVKYEVINELFTDYAMKDRYIYVPEGRSADLKEDGFFDWPDGSLIVKNFGYSKEQIGEDRMMETRVLIKDSDAWKAISYVWDSSQKEAKISKVGDLFPLNLKQNGEMLNFDYVVPNKNQCKSCHNKNEKIDPLGLKYANLNKDLTTEEGSVNQLTYLESRGIIKLNQNSEVLNTMVAYEDKSASKEDRALAYLDVNCGHCHRPDGPGNTSGLFLQYDEKRKNHLGFCKGPVAAGKGSGGRQFDIYPGVADSSILYFRMASLDPGVMMPEIGRSLAHKEGLQIVKEWIDNLEHDCYAAPE